MMILNHLTKVVGLAFGITLFSGSCVSVLAANTITLKFAMSVPPTHYTATQGGQFFMKKVEELTNGRVHFEWFPSQQLGKAKDLLKLVQADVADIGDVVPSYVSDKLPLYSVSELPGAFETSCEGTAIVGEMTKVGGFLDKEEFAPNGVRVLMAADLAPYKVLTTKVPVRSLADMKGLKLRVSGAAVDTTVRSLGAVGVRLTGPELNDALSRGTVDGAIYPVMSLHPFGIESIRYMVANRSVGTVGTTFMINLKKFKSLPADIQTALTKAGELTAKHYCTYIDSEEQKEIKGRSEIEKIDLSAQQLRLWNQKLSDVRAKWIKTYEAQGRPATEASKKWEEIKKKFGYTDSLASQ